MAPTKEFTTETMQRIIQLLQDGNPTRFVAKDVATMDLKQSHQSVIEP